MRAHTERHMTTKRGSRYWIKRSLRGLGRIERTLGTSSAVRADELERMIVRLHDRGRVDLVRAWLDGRTTLPELWHHYDTGTLGALTERLARPVMPTTDAVDAFVAHRRGSVRPRTLARYEVSLSHFVRLAPPTVQDALTGHELEAFQSARIREGAARETVNNDMVAISSLATYCVRRGWTAVRPPIPRFKPEPRVAYLAPDQVTLYLATVRPAFRCQMMLLLATGMRLGETEALTPSDLKWDGAGLTALVRDAKTPDGIRPVHVPDWAAEAVQAHVRATEPGSGDPLFTIPRRTVQAEHRRACTIAGLPGYTLHDHRHTAAVLLARAGMPIPTLQHQLGHATIQQTMRYAKYHPDHADTRRYFDRVARALGDVSGDSQRSVSGA